MALEVNLKDGESGGVWVADRKLWKTADGQVVEDGDPKAAFLYATEGYPVPIEEAEQHGLTKQRSGTPRDKQRKEPARDKADTPEDLDKLTRPKLDARAAELGVEDPAKLPNKQAVIDAIKAKAQEGGE